MTILYLLILAALFGFLEWLLLKKSPEKLSYDIRPQNSRVEALEPFTVVSEIVAQSACEPSGATCIVTFVGAIQTVECAQSVHAYQRVNPSDGCTHIVELRCVAG